MTGAQLARGVWWLATVAPDPLPPVDQDVDAIHEQACKLVSENTSVCSPPPPPPTGGGSGGGSGIDLNFVAMLLWLVLFAAVAGLLYLLGRWLMTRTGSTSRRRRRKHSTDDGDDELEVIEGDAVAVDRSREPVNWRSEAEQHRQAGRYRDALRCRYRALVGDLARRGLIDEIPGRTTGEERAQLRRVQPSASTPFNSAADLFDGAWYGHRDVSAGDDDTFQELERDVLATATTATRAGSRR
ncbi:MAG: DUF4129 domain-containing protein [Actinomycetota bacterium]|nr:DUF4129 domain-containing protein [Actinomycetota bacterium]